MVHQYQDQSMSQQYHVKVTVTAWLVTLFLLFIPVVNIIMLLIWAFDSTTNPSKKSFSQVCLVFSAILFALFILFCILCIPLLLIQLNSALQAAASLG